MLTFLKSLYTTPDRAGSRLYNDAVVVIQTDQKNCSASYLQRTADLAREELSKLEARLKTNPKDHDVFSYEIRQQHRNARQRRDYPALTAMTLVQIHLRAKKLGEPGLAAIAIIDEFITNPLEQDTDGEITDP